MSLGRTTAQLAAAAVLTLLAAGCGGGEGGGATPLATPTASPSGSATPGASPSASTDAGGGFDDTGVDILRGEVDATTPDQEAVADAWFEYWEVRTRSYNEVAVDPELGRVATGKAANEVVAYVQELRQAGEYVEGDTRFSLRALKVTGDRASLRSCAANQSTDRKKDGSPAEPLTPFYSLRGQLVREGGAWRVSEVVVLDRNPCRA